LIHRWDPEELPVIVVVFFSPYFYGSLGAATGNSHDRSAAEDLAWPQPVTIRLACRLLLWLGRLSTRDLHVISGGRSIWRTLYSRSRHRRNHWGSKGIAVGVRTGRKQAPAEEPGGLIFNVGRMQQHELFAGDGIFVFAAEKAKVVGVLQFIEAAGMAA